jgi:hypothetical protein
LGGDQDTHQRSIIEARRYLSRLAAKVAELLFDAGSMAAMSR